MAPQDPTNETALQHERCQRRLSEAEKSYMFIKRLLEFRYAYLVRVKPSLCKAITINRDFLSTDPRDSIIALLGLCKDGMELVARLSYQQPFALLVGDITKALLLQRKYVEVVFINRLATSMISPATPAPLPSWFPDGLSADSSESAWASVNKQLTSWGKLWIPDTIGSELDVAALEVLGVMAGTIVATTSNIGRNDMSEGRLNQRNERIRPLDQSTRPATYYKPMATFL
jgi:hypothetical protein